MTFLLAALISLTAHAATPEVPNLKATPCYSQTLEVIKGEYNKFKWEDGRKLGSEVVDFSDFVKLPTRQYFGMGGEFHFGLVGYARINFMGDATSHLYNYVVSASCVYDADKKAYVLDDENLDGKLDKDDVSLRSMDFER